MKKILILLLLVAPLSMFAQSAPKFGFVNFNEIIVLMPEYSAAESELAKLMQQYNDEYESVRTEFERKSLQYEQLQDSLSENLLKRRQEELQNIYMRLQQIERETPQTMQQEQQKKFAKVAGILNDAIQAVGTEGGYVCVFDISNGTMPYVSTTLCDDLNAKVKAKLGISLTAK